MCYNFYGVYYMNKKNDINKIIVLGIILIVSYLIISNFKFVSLILCKVFKALLPFLLGIVLAFVLNIFMVKIEKFIKKLTKNKINDRANRLLSITITLVLFILVIVFILLELVPELVNNIEALIKNIPIMINNIEEYLLKILSNYPEIQAKIINVFNDSTNLNKLLMNMLNYLVNGSINIITNFISSIITIFTALVFAIYMLSQKEYLINGLRKVLNAYLPKKKCEKIFSIASLSNVTFSKFVSGQCLEALLLGLIFFVVLSLFRFPYTLLISLLTTITALIPIFGALIAMVIGAILIATVSPIKALLFIIIFVIIQQIEGNLIYPKVVGKSVGLSPIWTLLAVTVGGSLFGIVGMLIGLPLASIFYAIFVKDVNNKTKNKIL